MRKSKYYKRLILGCSLCVLATSSHAFPIPTIDASAIAEGIITNIELVKQTEIVTDATKNAGEIKSAIGSPQTSLSDLENDEKAEDEEKKEKEKSNLEKAKEKYKEYKSAYEETKKAYEENKERLQKHKEELEKGINEAQQAYNQINNTSDSSSATTLSNTEAGDAKNITNAEEEQTPQKNKENQYNQIENNIPRQTTSNTKLQSLTNSGDATSNVKVFNMPQNSNNADINTGSDSSQTLQEALEEIEQLKKELLQLTGQNTNEESITPEDLNAAKEEIAKLKAELEKYKKEDIPTPEVSSTETIEEESNKLSAKVFPSTEQSYDEENDNGEPEQDLEVLPATQGTSEQVSPKSFRKIQKINTNDVFDKRTEIKEINEVFTATFSKVETLKFAKEETTDSTTETPIGKNAATDEYIISEELAQYCNLNINKASENDIKNCLIKLIAYQSEANMATAEKGKNFVYSVLYDAAVALTAEAAYYKNIASNYKTDVLVPKKADENKSQTDTRDDIKVVSSNVKLLQALMANVNKIYASRLLYEGLNEATQYQLKDVDSTTADTNSGTDKKTTEKGA